MIKTAKPFKHFPAVASISLAVLLIVIQPGPQLSMAESIVKMPHVAKGYAFPFYDRSGTYIFGLEPSGGDKPISNAANWWRINDDPSTGFRPVVRRAKMSSGYGHGLAPFTLNNHPYLFGLRVAGANFWRINDDPATGFRLVNYKEKMSVNYVDVVFFQLKGKSYMLGLHADKGANIWQLTEEKDGRVKLNLVKYGAKMAERYRYLKVFYMEGHPYIFGLHRDVGANIWRVNDDPSKGLDLVMYGARISSRTRICSYLSLEWPSLFVHGEYSTNEGSADAIESNFSSQLRSPFGREIGPAFTRRERVMLSFGKSRVILNGRFPSGRSHPRL